MTDLITQLEAATETSPEIIRRFVAKIKFGDGCWEWQACKDPARRGRFGYEGKPWCAHRLMWAWLNGPIPADRQINHHCDNPTCVRPDHLYCGTQKQNVADMMRRGRHWSVADPERSRMLGRQAGLVNTWSRGANSNTAKLTEEQARTIFESDVQTKHLMRQYDVSRSTIQKIRRGETWTHFGDGQSLPI